MSEPSIQEDRDGITFVAKIVPGSSRTSIAGVLDDMIKVKVAAPPEKGKANQCLVAFLARQLDVKKNTVSITAGQTSPVKHVHVAGISAAVFRERLGLNE
jgi:uncharacterized protein (TIGR00251 family)